MRELAILSRLRSPFVVLFMGMSELDSDIVLISEFVAKGSLHSFLLREGSSLKLSQRIQLLLDVARGLTHLHGGEQPILHRDLTPFNVSKK